MWYDSPDALREDRELVMAIYRLLQNRAFGPEEIDLMVSAFEQALVVLALKNRDDPATELVAKHIIKVTQTGECDPAAICSQAVAELVSSRAA
jgi:hypothetical protein